MKLQLTRPLIFLDGEFTGIDAETDRLIELSIVKVFPDNTREVRTKRFNPGVPSCPEALEVHGITEEMLANEFPFSKYAKNIHAILNGCDIALFGGNKIDARILYNEFSRANIDWDYSDVNFVDVGNLYKIMEPRDLKTAVMFYCGREHEGAHGAEADTIATLDVLMAQIDKYDELPITVKELALKSNFDKPVLDLGGKFTTNESGDIILNFGPKRGELASENISFLEWMGTKNFPADTMRIAYKIMGI
jgi:DNA polymerase-3 subunit epsilon